MEMEKIGRKKVNDHFRSEKEVVLIKKSPPTPFSAHSTLSTQKSTQKKCFIQQV